MTLSREEYERRASRTCKNCGKRLGELGVKDQRRLTCSARCGHESRMIEKVTVPCIVCGAELVRYQHEFKQHGCACCSARCQRVHAARQQWKKARFKRIKLPVLHICQCGELDEKTPCRDCKSWQTHLGSVATKSAYRFRERGWSEIFRSMCRFHSLRITHKRLIGSETKEPSNWSVALRQAQRRSLCSMTWKQKLGNMASNQRQRMERKSQGKDFLQC